MREWYVVAREPKEGDYHVEVFGPFTGEVDAQAYAIDLVGDNGWAEVEATQLTHDEAQTLSTDGGVMWPYDDKP